MNKKLIKEATDKYIEEGILSDIYQTIKDGLSKLLSKLFPKVVEKSKTVDDLSEDEVQTAAKQMETIPKVKDKVKLLVNGVSINFVVDGTNRHEAEFSAGDNYVSISKDLRGRILIKILEDDAEPYRKAFADFASYVRDVFKKKKIREEDIYWEIKDEKFNMYLLTSLGDLAIHVLEGLDNDELEKTLSEMLGEKVYQLDTSQCKRLK